MTKRDRMMILAVLGIVLLGGFWFLAITPQRKAASEAQARLAAAQLELDAAQQKVTAGRAARQAFRRDRTTILKLGRVVPETDDVPTLLTQLSALAAKENVEFVSYSIDSGGGQSSGGESSTGGAQSGTRSTDAVAPLYAPGSIEVEGGLGRTPISLTITGKYFELERYLRAVQRFAVLSAKQTSAKGRLIIVDGFSYSPDASGAEAVTDGQEPKPKKASQSPELTATLSASIYFAPPLETPAASSTGGSTSAPTPAATPGATPSTSTGAATVGGLR